jgi:hypothetical protein
MSGREKSRNERPSQGTDGEQEASASFKLHVRSERKNIELRERRMESGWLVG